MIDKSIFRAYDIRGIAEGKNIQLNEESAYLIGKGVSTYLIQTYQAKNIAIGHDTRSSSESLKNALIKGIKESGLQVFILGEVPTPITYFSTFQDEIDAGISVTASHNPKEYNGFKLIGKNGHSICDREIFKILELIEKKDFIISKTTSKEKNLNLLEKYEKKILETKHKTPLKLGLDCQNGAFSNYAKTILEKMGHEVFQIHAESKEDFPYKEANPTKKENVEKLKNLVLKEKLDIGIAFDGDGDRVGIVTKNGNLIDSNHLLLLLSQFLIKENPRLKVVVDITTSQIIINEIEKTGAKVFISKTGNNNIERKMKEINGDIGAESSGHFFISQGYFGYDDGLFVATKIISYILENKNKLDEKITKIPQSEITENIYLPCQDSKKDEVINMLKDFLDSYTQDHTDGIRIKFSSLDWGIIRTSNTSPNLTFRVEAQEKEKLKEYSQILHAALKESGHVDTNPLNDII